MRDARTVWVSALAVTIPARRYVALRGFHAVQFRLATSLLLQAPAWGRELPGRSCRDGLRTVRLNRHGPLHAHDGCPGTALAHRLPDTLAARLDCLTTTGSQRRIVGALSDPEHPACLRHRRVRVVVSEYD